jgi:hypothetical protein
LLGVAHAVVAAALGAIDQQLYKQGMADEAAAILGSRGFEATGLKGSSRLLKNSAPDKALRI